MRITRGFVSGRQIGKQDNCRHRLKMESGRGEAVSSFEGLGADLFSFLSPLPYQLTPHNFPYLPEERNSKSRPCFCTVAKSVLLWYNTGVTEIQRTEETTMLFHREEKFILTLSAAEYRLLVQSLLIRRNKLVDVGGCTEDLDDLLAKLCK